MCCLTWCQLTLKKIQPFQRRDMSWHLMVFFWSWAWPVCRSSAFEIPSSPDLSLKYILIQVHDQQGHHKEKKAKRKKKRYKETENSVARSRTRFICTFKQLLDLCTTVTHIIWKINFVISKQFFSAIDTVWNWWSCIYHEFKYTFEEDLLKRVFQSYFSLFRFNGPTRCR